MDLVFKLVALILTASVIRCEESPRNLKTIRVNKNIIYDCVDIYKQPSLNHPLLQNHKIQMEPSFSISKPKHQVRSESEHINLIECPNGTVPIIRNTKRYAATAQYWAEKHFNPLTIDSPGTHIAGVRSQGQGPYHGVGAWMSVHDLNISTDQISYTNIFVGRGVNNKVNFIQTGWMVNPRLFGEKRAWSFGYWKGANGKGCYNTICPGFIQVSRTDPLSEPFPYLPKVERAQFPAIVQDRESGNWWTLDVKVHHPDVYIGYWPKELFDLIGNGVDMVGVTGAVQASPSGKSPPMGNGHLPSENENESARVTHLDIVDSKFKTKRSDKYKLEKLLDNNVCYGLKDGKNFLFTYGGPGGDSCGR